MPSIAASSTKTRVVEGLRGMWEITISYVHCGAQLMLHDAVQAMRIVGNFDRTLSGQLIAETSRLGNSDNRDLNTFHHDGALTPRSSAFSLLPFHLIHLRSSCIAIER